jgi:hypothetical protein
MSTDDLPTEPELDVQSRQAPYAPAAAWHAFDHEAKLKPVAHSTACSQPSPQEPSFQGWLFLS